MLGAVTIDTGTFAALVVAGVALSGGIVGLAKWLKSSGARDTKIDELIKGDGAHGHESGILVRIERDVKEILVTLHEHIGESRVEHGVFESRLDALEALEDE